MTNLTGRVRLCLRGGPGAGRACARAFAAALTVSVTGGTVSAAAGFDHAPYGTTQGGQAVDIFTMTNEHGLRVRIEESVEG